MLRTAAGPPLWPPTIACGVSCAHVYHDDEKSAGPATRTLDRPMPAGAPGGHLVTREPGFEALVEPPEGRQLFLRLPEARAEARECRGAEGRGLGVHRAQHGHAEQIRLELQQQVVACRAAIDSQLRQRLGAIQLHGFDE